MATWQQGNSGSFLAGIGSNNTNAPQASDINATLGMIRDNNDRERAGENNLGMQLANATGSIFNSWKQGQQQQRQGEFQKAYAGAYASGDRGAMRQLAAQYPEQFEAVQKGMGFIDDDQRNTVGSLAASARLAAQSPETMGKWLQSNAGELARAGVNPADVATMYQQNPQGFGEFADHLGMAAIGPEKYFEFQDKAVGRDIDRGKLAEQVRSNKAGEGLQARGQDIQIRGQNISAQNAALDREIKRAEVQDKVLDRQIARETNAIKLEELKQKQVDVRQKAEVARADRQATAQGAIDTFDTALNSLKTITSSPGLSKAVGFNSAFPTIPGSDAANFEAQLDTFKAQTFLPMVQSLKGMGALSDAEGKKLSDAVGALSPKMSEEAFRKSAGTIEKTLQNKLQNVKKQYGYQDPVQAPQSTQPAQQAGFSSLWGE
ncbi:DNA injection protein [Serratia fonticola]|nr:DNA injection protein [Serratia fonticola]